jgi:hypothetical protein
VEACADLEVSEHGPHADDWEHARKVARAYLGAGGA